MTDELDKKYYKIKDVSEFLGVPASTLRYWEKEFPGCSPVRSPHNLRYYKPADIETLRIIKFLVKDKGLRIEAAREQLRLNRKNVTRRLEVIERLEALREELVTMQEALKLRATKMNISNEETTN